MVMYRHRDCQVANFGAQYFRRAKNRELTSGPVRRGRAGRTDSEEDDVDPRRRVRLRRRYAAFAPAPLVRGVCANFSRFEVLVLVVGVVEHSTVLVNLLGAHIAVSACARVRKCLRLALVCSYLHRVTLPFFFFLETHNQLPQRVLRRGRFLLPGDVLHGLGRMRVLRRSLWGRVPRGG